MGGKTYRLPEKDGAGLSMSRPQFQDSEDEKKGGCLCFFLGSFGIIGVLIAAVIAKRDGVVAALWGWLVSWVFFALLLFAFMAIAAKFG